MCVEGGGSDTYIIVINTNVIIFLSYPVCKINHIIGKVYVAKNPNIIILTP